MSLKVRKYVHVFMGDTNDVYTIVTAQIKYNVLALRKTIVALRVMTSKLSKIDRIGG